MAEYNESGSSDSLTAEISELVQPVTDTIVRVSLDDLLAEKFATEVIDAFNEVDLCSSSKGCSSVPEHSPDKFVQALGLQWIQALTSVAGLAMSTSGSLSAGVLAKGGVPPEWQVEALSLQWIQALADVSRLPMSTSQSSLTSVPGKQPIPPGWYRESVSLQWIQTLTDVGRLVVSTSRSSLVPTMLVVGVSLETAGPAYTGCKLNCSYCNLPNRSSTATFAAR